MKATHDSKNRIEDGVPVENRDELVRCCLPPRIRDGLPHIAGMVSELLMPLHEAITKAAELGQVLWLDELLARPGRMEMMDGDVAVAVAVAAAVHGHAEAVKMVFARVRCRNELYMAWKVLNVSAARGHLEVVKFASAVLQKHTNTLAFALRAIHSDALSTAIHGGYLHVVEFLIRLKHFRWDYTECFQQAVDENQDNIARFMYENFADYFVGGIEDEYHSLLAQLASDGHMEAVKYLYDHRAFDEESIGEAFHAAVFGWNDDVVEFLIDTGSISLQSIGEVFVEAVETGLSDMVSLLCQKQSVSPRYLNEAFVTTGDEDIMKVLLSTGQVLRDSIAKGFQEVAKQGSLDMIEYLLRQYDVPAEAITTALLDAVKRGCITVVKCVFAQQHTFAFEIGEAFKDAVETGKFRTVEILVHSSQVSQDMKNEALVRAARYGHRSGRNFIKNSSRWSRDVLEQALQVAKDAKTKRILRRKLR